MTLTTLKGTLRDVFDHADRFELKYTTDEHPNHLHSLEIPKDNCFGSLIATAKKSGFIDIEVVADADIDRKENQFDVQKVNLGKVGETRFSVYEKAFTHG